MIEWYWLILAFAAGHLYGYWRTKKYRESVRRLLVEEIRENRRLRGLEGGL